MPISDNHPERRNLTLLSLAIIVFYLADGYFIDNEVNFQIVNIGFRNRDVLGYFVWVALFWFLFKYWLVTKGVAGELLRHEQSYTVKMDFEYIKNYILKNSENKSVLGVKTDVRVYRYDTDWTISGYGNSAKLLGIKGNIILIHYLLNTAHLHRITTDYFMPYVFFLVAVTLGILNVCTK